MSASRTVGRIVLGGLAMLFAFSALYVAAFHAPRPKGVDVGMVGTPAQAKQLQSSLDAASRGAFDVERYAGEGSAREALLDTDVQAVMLPGRILVAQALGIAPTETVTEALRRSAPGAAVEDLRPLPPGDRRGLSPLFTVIATLIPSMAVGTRLAVAGRTLPPRARWLAVLAYSVGAGLVVAFNVDVLVGALDGHFLGVAAVSGMLALAVSATAHGLGRLGGRAGIATAVLMLLLLGVSSAGGAVTYQFEPGFYGGLSQLLPPGAALTAVRNVQYFDWAATLAPMLVLAAWAVAGVLFGLLGERFAPRLRTIRT